MSRDLRQALAPLAAVPGVRAVLLATEGDGLTVDAVAAFDVDTDALAAFATALFRRTHTANRAAGFGATSLLALDAARGRVLVAACGDMALVVLADREAGTGMIRVAMQRVAREVA